MLILSQTGPIDDLITAVQALPESTESVAAPIATAVKALAVSLLQSARTDIINAATINLRANTLPVLNAQQIEIQVTGRKA